MVILLLPHGDYKATKAFIGVRYFDCTLGLISLERYIQPMHTMAAHKLIVRAFVLCAILIRLVLTFAYISMANRSTATGQAH